VFAPYLCVSATSEIRSRKKSSALSLANKDGYYFLVSTMILNLFEFILIK
jgi:hypothetical protein